MVKTYLPGNSINFQAKIIIWREHFDKNFNMDEIKHGTVIEFFMLKRPTAVYIKTKLYNVYGNSSPAQITIYKCIREFRSGRTSVLMEHGGGWPTTAMTEENIKLI